MKNQYFLSKFLPASRLLKKSLGIASIMLLGAGAAFAQSNPIGSPGKAGDFEIDGDFIPNNLSSNCNLPACSSNGLDWRSVLKVDPNNPGFVIPGNTDVANENARWVVDGNSGSSVSPGNIEIETFAGTSNKNGDYVTLTTGASPYSIDTSNPSAPQKNDLTNIYIRSTTIAGKTWLMMGAEVLSTDGTSYLDFEYNQAGMFKSATQMFGPISKAATGGRTAKNGTAGDALFVVDFSKGGNVPIAKVFEWQLVTKGNKTVYSWVEKTIPQNLIFIVTNGNNVAPAGVNTAFGQGGAPSNTMLAHQFVEIGVNLTDVFGNFNPCAPEATMLVKTRTSSSYTSELKDFSLFNFALVEGASIEAIDDVALCPSQDAAFDATVAGPGALAANVHFFKVITPDDPATQANEEVLASELLNGALSGRIGITTLGLTKTLSIDNVIAADTGLYKCTLTGSTCGAAPKYFRLILNSVDAPVVTLLEPSVCEARAKGLLSVCNPLEGANYYVEQLDENGDPVLLLHQEVLGYDPLDGALTFDLEPGYPFELKVNKNGCEETVDCDDVVSECPSVTTNSAPIRGNPKGSKQGNNSGPGLGTINTPEQNLVAYPIPFSESVTVEFKASKAENYVINLYDLRGHLVRELKAGSAQAGEVIKVQVSGSGMAESMYLVRKVSKSGISTVKLLKKE